MELKQTVFLFMACKQQNKHIIILSQICLILIFCQIIDKKMLTKD